MTASGFSDGTVPYLSCRGNPFNLRSPRFIIQYWYSTVLSNEESL